MEGSFGSLRATRMMGLLIVLAGLSIGAIGILLLRRSGSGWRIGRLLSAAPRVSLEEAVEAARHGDVSYVSLHGRVDSDEEFPGDNDKPLVFRRRRLQRDSGRSGWSTFDDERLAVPFRLVERGERVEIDGDALGDGLVVVPRISVGVASDLTPEASSSTLPDLPPDTPVRLRIDQVSAVDHATAAGVPRLRPDGSVLLSAGMGRPLILTTLDPDEAMRVLASEHRSQLLVGAGLLVAAPIVTVVGVVTAILGV
ncbi:MAG: hypothetical protein ACC726_09400 [Chloroflexota bacterium]